MSDSPLLSWIHLADLAFGALYIDVDPLVVAGGLGEAVDALLVDQHPVGHAQLLADHVRQLGDGYFAHPVFRV